MRVLVHLGCDEHRCKETVLVEATITYESNRPVLSPDATPEGWARKEAFGGYSDGYGRVEEAYYCPCHAKERCLR